MDISSVLDGMQWRPILLVEKDWNEILAMDIPESCIICTFLSSPMHNEVVEICISSFTRITEFIECTITSRPCCARSDLADQLKARIQDFYNAHFTPGQSLNHGFVPCSVAVVWPLMSANKHQVFSQ